MATRPAFPLPKGYFGPVVLTKDQEERYREIVRSRLQTALADEHEFTVVRKRHVDASKWKLYKSKEQLHAYKQRRSATTKSDTKLGSMLCIGRLEGSLEDMVYGMYDKSHDEMHMSMKYMDATMRDCTVLHTIDLATRRDPFHYLGFKWFITRFPAGASLLIKDRDWPYLEATGIETDSTGRRYGYLILHAVSLPNVPPFDQSDVVRGQLFFSFLFRELDGGYIDIFSQGLFDPAGDVLTSVSAVMTHATLMAVSKAAKCAEAKKLTVLALATATANATTNAPLPGNRHRCSVCTRASGVFTSLHVCRVCRATVCAKCRLKKFLFVGQDHAIVHTAVCPPCVLTAKTMSVRPAEHAFSILAESHLPLELLGVENNSTGTNSDAVGGGDSLDDDDDDDDGSEGDYTMSVSSDMSEDDMEGVIEALRKQKLASGRGSGKTATVLLEERDENLACPRVRPVPPGSLSDFEFRNLNDPHESMRRPLSAPSYAYAQPPQNAKDDGMYLNERPYQSARRGVDFQRPTEYQSVGALSDDEFQPMPSTAARAYDVGGQPPGMASHQLELFHKMVALQNSAQHVYQITKANEEFMRNLPRSESK